MVLRPSVADTRFDHELFGTLRDRLLAGDLDAARTRLEHPPPAPEHAPIDLRRPALPDRAALAEQGRQTLEAGAVAAIIMNGGMATRFGGGAKGLVPVVEGHPLSSFLAVKLGQVHQLGAPAPAIIMHSFATRAASDAHLEAIDWSGIPDGNRHTFEQGIMPRLDLDGTPLAVLADAAVVPDTSLYAAPGHGDLLRSIRETGMVDTLRARGVEHVLVSNVDNVGASLEPSIVGAHVRATGAGSSVTVEVVKREPGDAGGCIARSPRSGAAAVIEGFRLPPAADLSSYPHFNTNTLWFHINALSSAHDLTWFAVRRTVPWANGTTREAVQFEQLIGQITELVPTTFIEVDRGSRFVPIKTLDDLARARPVLRRIAADAGVIPG